jgi:hypothetical protein
MGKDSITYWLPCGLRMSYTGTPKSRWEWLWLTWRGYFAMWCLLFHASRLLAKLAALPETKTPQRTTK